MLSKTIFKKYILKTKFRIITRYIFTHLETLLNFLKLSGLIQRVKSLALFTHYFTLYKHPEILFLKCSSQMRPLHYQILSSSGQQETSRKLYGLFHGATCQLTSIVLYFALTSKTEGNVLFCLFVWFFVVFNLLLNQHHKPCLSIGQIKRKENMFWGNLRLVKVVFTESSLLDKLEPRICKYPSLTYCFN